MPPVLEPLKAIHKEGTFWDTEYSMRLILKWQRELSTVPGDEEVGKYGDIQPDI